MPRIPDIADLPRTGLHNLPDVRIDTGAEKIGAALSGFADAFGEFTQKVTQRDARENAARQQLDLTHRTAKAADEIDGFVGGLKDDPEYTNYVDRFDAKVDEVRNRHRDGLAPEAAGRFDAKFRDLAAAHGLAVRNLGTQRLVDGASGALDDIVGTYGRLAARAPNQAAGNFFVDQAFKAIGGLADAGLIRDGERLTRQNRFMSALAGTQIEDLLEHDPDLAESVLDDPAELPGLDDESRNDLVNRTRPRIEASRRDREIAAQRAEAAALAEREAAARTYETDWRARLDAGTATHDEIEAARAEGVLTEGRTKALRTELDHDTERRGRDLALRSRIGEALDAGRRLDPADPDDVAAADLAFRERTRPALIEGIDDPKRMITLLPAIRRDIDRLGVAPGELPGLAEAWWSSGDPKFQAGAARLIDMVYRPAETDAPEERPRPLGPAVPDELRQQAQLAVRLMDAGVAEEVAVKRAQEVAVAEPRGSIVDENTTPSEIAAEGDSSNLLGPVDNIAIEKGDRSDIRESDDEGSRLDDHEIRTSDSSQAETEILAGAAQSEHEKDEPRLTRIHRNQLERAYRNLADGWRQGGRPQAADNLDRFLDGGDFSAIKSKPLIFSREAAREFSPIEKAEFENEQRFENQTFLAMTKDEEFNRKLKGLKDGESVRLPDHWKYDYDTKRAAKDALGGDTDFYFAFGRTKFRSDIAFQATRHGDRIDIEGTVAHGWNDVYDFGEQQPGGGGALALQKYRGARPFDIAAAWSRHVKGTVDVHDGKLENPKFIWKDMEDPAQ